MGMANIFFFVVYKGKIKSVWAQTPEGSVWFLPLIWNAESERFHFFMGNKS